MDDTSKYRELFFEETDEYLQRLNENLLILEKETQNVQVMEEIFRAAHTLKGMAATMGYETMTELTHHMENVFELFKKEPERVSSNAVTVIFSCLDQLSMIVEDLREEKEVSYDIKDLNEELESLLHHSEEEAVIEPGDSLLLDQSLTDIDLGIIRAAIEKEYHAYNILVKVSSTCMLKGARAYLVVTRLENDGEIIVTTPSAEDLEEGRYDQSFRLVYLSHLPMEPIKESILNVAEVEEVSILEITEENMSEFLVSEDFADNAGLYDEEEEEKEDGNNTASEPNSKVETRGEKLDKKERTSLHAHQGSQSIRVDLARLDSFMNLVSELVIYRTRLEDLSTRFKATELTEPLEQVARITSDLQDLVLQIRMQPVNVVFNRFPRMIRDLSVEMEKDMELVIEGEETELDRTVVSELGEPLVHLIRNAADHGIETAEERRKQGKNPHGTITLSAYQEGNQVVIKVADDGKGLDPDMIRKSAIRKGIDAENLNDYDAVQLIFNQGFSTNKEVTAISGRGVGMDVVRSKITSLGGNIDVKSIVGQGTTFLIRLPLTLSIIEALMVKVGGEIFALPLGMIEKVVKLNQDDIKTTHNGEVYLYREKVVPVIRIHEKLLVNSTETEHHLILVHVGGRPYGILVDHLLGQQEIVIKKLTGSLGKMKEYLGAAILGNGEITLILDLSNLCAGAENRLE